MAVVADLAILNFGPNLEMVIAAYDHGLSTGVDNVHFFLNDIIVPENDLAVLGVDQTSVAKEASFSKHHISNHLAFTFFN